MNTIILKNLAKHVVMSGGLKKSETKKIVSLLTPKDLRTLSHMILSEQEKETAYVTTADVLSRNEKAAVDAAFPHKRIVMSVDAKIGAGLRAQVYDMIYDLSIKSKIENIAKELEEEL